MRAITVSSLRGGLTQLSSYGNYSFSYALLKTVPPRTTLTGTNRREDVIGSNQFINPVSGTKLFSTVINSNSDQVKPVKVHEKSLNIVQGLADSKKINKEVDQFREGKFDTIPNPSDLPHFRQSSVNYVEKSVQDQNVAHDHPPIGAYVLPHPIWTEEQVQSVEITHKTPEGFTDKIAYKTVQLFRSAFDLFSGFKFGQTNERKWLKRQSAGVIVAHTSSRICFLETVAGVPGMVAAMMRHMRSLRRMQRDQGWIHTLLEEAENERMHLLTALQLKQPSLLFRLCVIGSQGVFVTMFGISYVISPKFCHRFVGYLEEEAVKTYTKCLQDIEQGSMQHWKTQPAPDVALRYWKLKPDATMKDVILAIRADEAHHRVVNHCLASLRKDEFNPYKPGQ